MKWHDLRVRQLEERQELLRQTVENSDSLKEASEALGISREHISVMLRQQFGLTFNEMKGRPYGFGRNGCNTKQQ